MYLDQDNKYHFPFNFEFDYEKLLEDCNALTDYTILTKRTGSGKAYGQAEEGDEITLKAYKLSLYKNEKVKDNKHNLSIINQCKKLFDAVGSLDNDLILVIYDKDSFLGWHIDNPQDSGYGRINIIVTDNWSESPIIFKENDNEIPCPAKLAVVNTYGAEHMYDNRGKEKRILLCMTTHDVGYTDLVHRIKKL